MTLATAVVLAQAAPVWAQDADMRDVDAVSAPRGIAVPDLGETDPAAKSSPRRHYPIDEGDVQRIWTDIRVHAAGQDDAVAPGPSVYAARDTDHADDLMVLSPAPVDTPVRSRTRRDGPNVVATGDETVLAQPVVVLAGRKVGQIEPRAALRQRPSGGGPNIIFIDEARDVLPGVIAARQPDGDHDGPTVIATRPIDELDRPIIKYRGRQLND